MQKRVKGVIRVQITEGNVTLKSSPTNFGRILLCAISRVKIGQAEVIRQKEEIQCRKANLNEADYQITSKRQELEEFVICVEEQASISS